jgi:hypothetical protein
MFPEGNADSLLQILNAVGCFKFEKSAPNGYFLNPVSPQDTERK